MKYVYTIACLLLVFTVNAQKKTDPAELYPVFKSIKVKWDRNTDYLSGPTNVDECISGNCTDGEGVRLVTGSVQSKYSSYTLYGTILKGQFSGGGNRFTGKVYTFDLPAGGVKKDKELRIGTPLDITDDAAMKPFYVGEGSYYMGSDQWNRGWDGEVKDLPALLKLFPGAEVHKAAFNKGKLNWIDVDLPATHRFIRYTGHTFASGDFMFGKAQLDNGDVYEGFFLRHSFHGPGRLTKRSGKILQGIWQIDSLTQDAAVEFPAALLQPVLPAPAKFSISELNGMDVNSFKHSATEVNISELSDFYGEVINNQASGWGLWKTNFTKGNANSNDDVQGMAYGYWKHNQLDGPGIYFTTAFQQEFWMNTGVYKNGKIVHGNALRANYHLLGNRATNVHGFPQLSLYQIDLSTIPLEGCGMQMELGYSSGYESRPTVNNIKEGYYTDGKLSGFYFENDKEKKRSYEFLGFAGYNRYWKYTVDILQSAEASSNFCFDAISRYKPLFIAEMKKKLAGDIAAGEWEKSPQGQAHKRQVELDNERYAAQRKKDCDAQFAKIGVKGRTYINAGSLVILESYDCDKKQYLAWRPRQGNDSYNVPLMAAVTGGTIFLSDKLEPSVKQYQTCDECNGTGKITVITTTTRTKDLPWGYFSGIETKSIRTTTKEELKTCSKCSGTAIVLK